MIHYWKATGELNMDASKEGFVYFKANLEKKAWKKAAEELKKKYNAFFISLITLTEVSEEEYLKYSEVI